MRWAEAVEGASEKYGPPDCREEQAVSNQSMLKLKETEERQKKLIEKLKKLIQENNDLVGEMQQTLGTRIASVVVSVPLDRLGFIGDILGRYFDNMIGKELIDKAKTYGERLAVVRKNIYYTRDQLRLAMAITTQAKETLDRAQTALERCLSSHTGK